MSERDSIGDLIGSLRSSGLCTANKAADTITELRVALRDTEKERDTAVKALLVIVPAADAMRDDLMYKDHQRVCDLYDSARKAFTRLAATDAAASETAPAGSAPAPVPDAESS